MKAMILRGLLILSLLALTILTVCQKVLPCGVCHA